MLNITELQSKITSLAEKYNLSLVVLFGSQATGKIHPGSDIDIGFIADKQMGPGDIAGMQLDFEHTMRMGPIECTDLKAVPPLLLKFVAIEGILLYEKTPNLFAEYKIYFLKLYMEASPLFKMRDEHLARFLSTH